MSIAEHKDALRARMKAAIAALPEASAAAGGEAAAQNLLSLPEYGACGTLFCYCSVKNEVDTRQILAFSLGMGKTVALPQVLPGGGMVFRAVTDPDSLRPGAFGIPEPGEACPERFPAAGDVCVVPGLCFDERGFRVGCGGGYFDRWLANNPVIKIGLCRESLLLDIIPAEPFDIRVDIIVTERRVVRL